MRQISILHVIAAALLLTFVASSSALADEPSAAKKPITPKDGVIKLFNGKSLAPTLTTHLNAAKTPDPKSVFTVRDGMIHATGNGFGGIVTKNEYRDYHCIFEYKWGPRTWGKRKTCAKDSGLLFHATGAVDTFGGSWPECFQASIIQGGTGGLSLVKARGPIALTCKVEAENRGGTWYWKKGAPKKEFTRGQVHFPGRDPNWKNVLGFRGKNDVASPDGQWTRIEVICKGGHVIFKINGIQTAEAFDLKPAAGKLMIQVEGAEYFIRRWELWPLGKAPKLPPIRPAAKKKDAKK